MAVNFRKRVYHLLPGPLQMPVRVGYQRLHPNRISDREVARQKRAFVEDSFESEAEYQGYIDELREEPVNGFLDEARARLQETRGETEISNTYFHDVYAYVRKTQPETVVETGVRDGWSTLYVLSALHNNDSGTLYSVDYPVRADEDAEFEMEPPSGGEAQPTIPAGKDPGWILPEALRDRWRLVTGKSQRELPQLFAELGSLDVFIHDSDHSLPCMLFEFELAWEWLGPGGVIFADDITWNEGFEQFTAAKNCDYGRTRRAFGYVKK